MVSNKAFSRRIGIIILVLLSNYAFGLGLAQSPTQSATPVPNFVSGSAKITLTDDTFTGRITVTALTSPGGAYELALIQDGFGRDKKFQYCWAEVHETTTPGDGGLAWRAPCNPVKVDACALVLTSDGDFRLEVASGGARAVAFLTDTAGDGVVDVQLTDNGDLLLVNADGLPVWQSSKDLERKDKCKQAFHPSSASPRLLASWTIGVTCSIALALAVSL